MEQLGTFIKKIIFLGILAMTAGSALPQEKEHYSNYSFLTDGIWTGKNQYSDKEHVFEIMVFNRRPGSAIYKVRRERNSIYLVEIYQNREFFPDISGDKGDRILKLDREIYQVEDIIRLNDGRVLNAPVTLYRQKNIRLEKSSDLLTGDWAFESSPEDIHEYRHVNGDYQFLIYIPDYDWYSKYAEEGWHYLGYKSSNLFETDNAFYDASFSLTVISEYEIILKPLFLKHDNTDGSIRLKRERKK